MKYTKLVFFFSILLIKNSYALVDYSEVSDNKNSTISKSQTTIGKNDYKSNLVWKSDLSTDLNYEMMELDNKKIGLMNLNTHFQTPMNIFFDVDYWQANGDSGSSSGNPKLILGFNWFKIGSSSDEASVNITAGARLKSNSELGSSRTDKIFGIETTKKFGNFGLGIGYELNLTSDPSRSLDLSIGNIQKIEFSAGWMATNDIQFEVAAENFKVSKSNSTTLSNKLNNDLSFSCLSPKMNLQIFRSVNFELGARYRMQKAQSNQDLKAAHLIDLHGAYSNSVFTGLLISI